MYVFVYVFMYVMYVLSVTRLADFNEHGYNLIYAANKSPIN